MDVEQNGLCLCGHRWRWHQSGIGAMVCFAGRRDPCDCKDFEEDGLSDMLGEIRIDEMLRGLDKSMSLPTLESECSTRTRPAPSGRSRTRRPRSLG